MVCVDISICFFHFLFVEPNVGKAHWQPTLVYTYINILYLVNKLKFEGHFVYLGEISEQHSLIRETDRDQPP